MESDFENAMSDASESEEESSGGFSDSQAEEVSDEDMETTEDEDGEEVLEESVNWAEEQEENETGDEEEEEDVARPTRRRVRKAMSSSSSEDEEEEGEEEPSSSVANKKKARRRKISTSEEEEENGVNATTSSGGEGVADSCTVCLLKMGSQELGRPDVCAHVFCADCIIEWSRNVPTCPIDRLPMRSISVTKDGQELRSYRVKRRRLQEVEEELAQRDPGEAFNMDCFCEACGSGDREDRLLLCDGCDLGHHLECLVPPLRAIPRGRWYCPTCEAAGVGVARYSKVALMKYFPRDSRVH